MGTTAFTPAFRMSGTAFRTLPLDQWIRESCPADFSSDLQAYIDAFGDAATGELIWRMTEAGKHNNTGRCWQGLHFDELVRAMRDEGVDPMSHGRLTGYTDYGIKADYKLGWPALIESAMHRLVDNADLGICHGRYIYPTAKLLTKMLFLRRPAVIR